MSLQVPPENLIGGVIANLELVLNTKGSKSVAKGTIEVRSLSARIEASACLFLYSYLVYTYDWYNKDKKLEEKNKSLRAMWENLVTLYKMFMTSKNPTTLCWMYDIMYLMGTKYDPRDIVQQDKKVRKSIEEVIVHLTTDTAMIAAVQNRLIVDENFNIAMPYNPSIYEQLMNTVIPEEKRTRCTRETETISLKFELLMPQFPKYPRKEGESRVIAGSTCAPYLRGCCFVTLREKLYELTEKMLSVTNKDKMSSVVSF